MRNFFTPPLVLALALLLLGIGGFFAENYISSTVDGKIVKLGVELGEKRRELAKANALQRAATSLEESELIASQHFLDKEDLVSYLGSLEASGKSTRASVQVVSVSNDQQGLFPRASVSLLITGSYDSVMRTIGALENSNYDTEVKSVTLSLNQGEGKKTASWSAATVFSVALTPLASTTQKKP